MDCDAIGHRFDPRILRQYQDRGKTLRERVESGGEPVAKVGVEWFWRAIHRGAPPVSEAAFRGVFPYLVSPIDASGG